MSCHIVQKNKTLLRALPLIARALGDSYGVKVLLEGSEAYTDGKTIVLPTLPIDDSDTTTLALGYIDHECGHVRETEHEKFKEAYYESPFIKFLLNVLEDIRIEKLMGTRFPGARVNLARLVKTLVRKGFFGRVNPTDPAELVSGYLLYALRSKELGQTGLDEITRDASSKLDQEYPGLRAELDQAVDFETKAPQSTTDCYDLVKGVVEIMKKYIKEPPKPPQPPQGQTEKGEGSPDSDQGQPSQEQGSGQDKQDSNSQNTNAQGDPSHKGNDQQGQESNSNEKSEHSSSVGQNSSFDSGVNPRDGKSPAEGQAGGSPDSTQGQWDSSKAQTLNKVLTAKENELISNLGEVLQQQLEEASKNAPSGCRGDGFGTADSATDSSRVKIDETKVRTTTNHLRVRLRGLLQAQTLKHSWTSRRGRKIDSRKIHRLCSGDSRIFRAKEMKKGLNTALHIVLDRSGSMRRKMDLANETMLAVKLALESLHQVNLGISAFPSDSDGYIPLVRHGVKTTNDIGLGASGGTPLGNTLWAIGGDMLPISAERKIIIVITDGRPAHPQGAHAAINGLRQAGYQLIGIGINNPSVETYFDYSCVIQQIEELPKALFGVLEKLLV